MLSLGTVLNLGTERHHKEYISGIDSFDKIGCFALTGTFSSSFSVYLSI